MPRYFIAFLCIGLGLGCGGALSPTDENFHPIEVPTPAESRSAPLRLERWATGHELLVGLKQPDLDRGMRRGQVLVDPSTVAAGLAAIRQLPGARVIAVDTLLPKLRVEVGDTLTVRRLEALPFVDYVEYATGDITFASGCDYNAWEDTYGFYGGNIMPHTFDKMQFADAWTRSSGSGVTIGLTDTGISEHQDELIAQFTSGQSTGRVLLLRSSIGSPYGDCSHGNRLAGVISAPHNGASVIGGAWGASLVSVRIADGVALVDAGDAADGIRQAASAGARIINMSWQSANWLSSISDEIEFWYYNFDVLFVAAAGTSMCNDVLPDDNVMFPAEMPEVLAVTAIDQNGGVRCGNHYGPEVELGAYEGQPTTGRYTPDIVSVERTSNAAAVVSSVAALVWSRYPQMSRDAVRARLRWATPYKGLKLDSRSGNGPINAFGAVGGLFDAVISGETDPTPTEPTYYTYSAVSYGGSSNLTYTWSTGQTTRSIQYLVAPVTEYNVVHELRVTVTDPDDGTTLIRDIWIRPRPYNPDCPDCICPTCM